MVGIMNTQIIKNNFLRVKTKFVYICVYGVYVIYVIYVI